MSHTRRRWGPSVPNTPPRHRVAAEKLRADVQRFVEGGGKIEKLPLGATHDNWGTKPKRRTRRYQGVKHDYRIP